jgi:signal transduction histidine kinase
VEVVGDQARIRQVLVNLLGNAVKFTPERGAISVHATVREVNGAAWGAVHVCDTGPGIPDAERAAVFEPYYRAPGTAHAPGVGLGLAISRALVERMGGRLEVEDRVGAGTTFTLTLPALRRADPS